MSIDQLHVEAASYEYNDTQSPTTLEAQQRLDSVMIQSLVVLAFLLRADRSLHVFETDRRREADALTGKSARVQLS